MSEEQERTMRSASERYLFKLIYLMTWLFSLCLGVCLAYVLYEAHKAFPAATPGETDATLLSFSRDRPDPRGHDAENRVAIIVDDLGSDMHVTEQILKMDIPVTLAVMPYRKYSLQTARMAFEKGREVLLHLPLQPRNYPLVDPGPGCLLASMDRERIHRELRDQIASLPYCVGVYPHMGSLFGEGREWMTWVVAALKENEMFFVDNISSPDSVVLDAARDYGIPLIQRTHFLDEKRNEAAIVRELCRLVDFAVANGWALGVAHPYPETLAALPKAVHAFREKRVKCVPASHLLPIRPQESGTGRDFAATGNRDGDGQMDAGGSAGDRRRSDGVS